MLPCRKLVLEYNETWPSSSGAKEYIEREAQQLAKRHPSVEFVVQEKPNRHPVARGFYGESQVTGPTPRCCVQ